MSTITAVEKIAMFEKELELIFDKDIREFTKLCLIAAPDYAFNDCPSSSSGRYHSVDELSFDGNQLHSKKVFTLVYDLCRGLGCEDKRDVLLGAALIHDMRKQGEKKSGHTVKHHPKLAAELVDQVQEMSQLLSEEDYKIFRQSVGYHYGPWSTGEWSKPLASYSFEELTVYIADYIASKRFVTIEYKR